MANLIYEMPTRYDRGIKILFLIILLVLVIPAIFIFDSDREGAFAMLGTVILVAFILWFIMPRKLRIMEDRLQVVLGSPFTFTIPFTAIKEVRIPRGLTSGVNFCTALSGVVQIVRKGKMSVNITPAEPAQFMEYLNKALSNSQIPHEGR